MIPDKLLKEYFPEVTEENQSEPISVLPLTIIDMLIEYGCDEESGLHYKEITEYLLKLTGLDINHVTHKILKS